MTAKTGPGPRRGETLFIDGPAGAVYYRYVRGKIRFRAYRNDGDTIREAELGLAAVRLFDTVYREVSGGSGVTLQHIRIYDDHEPA